MSWQAVTFALLALVLAGGFAWYERSRPTARLIALVAALAALAVAGRLVLAPVPNLVATTDIVLITGFALGAAPGFAVGALAAPISNIWLGQGPWTAWQMAAWGLVGLAGALFARLSGRRVNRLGLALACAAAGFGYGALLDLSTMVTYGGEQSLDRYLELSARGLPFNVVHALGNFAIALAAGPALVRMISRFRTRLEFSWPAAQAASLVVIATLGAATFGLARTDDAAAGTSPISWLQGAQGSDGGYAATLGQPSSPAMTGWTMLGLEAADTNPLDVRSGGETPVSYLRDSIDRLRAVGDLERTILALEGAGLNPRAFAGEDLVANLRDKRDSDGSVDGQVNLTAFYALAMRAAGGDSASLKRTAKWLRAAQNSDGGWGIQPRAPSEADSSGAALQGLIAAGGADKAADKGVRFLQRSQQSGGGWALGTSGIVNAQSTAWAIQGLVAAGSGGDAIDAGQRYLSRLRNADGHYSYSATSEQTPIWVTTQVILATERKAFPLAAVPRAQRAAPDANDGGGGGRGEGQSPASSGGGGFEGGGGGSTPSQGGSPGPRSAGDTGRGGGDDTPNAAAGQAPSPSGGSAAPESQADAAPAGTQAPTPVAEPAVAPSAPADDGEDATVLWLIAGTTVVAAAVGGGLAWYRRRLS